MVDALTGEIFGAEDVAAYYSDKEEGCDHPHGNAAYFGSTRMMATGTGSVFDPSPTQSAMVAYGTGGITDGGDANTADLTAQTFTYTLPNLTLTGGTYYLDGMWASIVDTESPFNGDYSQASSAFIFTRSDDGFEASNTYYHVDWMMNYLNVTLGCNITPLQYTGGARFDPHGLNGADNSHYTGGNGVIAFGEGCVDDAEDSDVVHHELGHALHDWVTGGNLSQVNGLSEGVGDYIASSYNRASGTWTPSDAAYYYMFNWDGHNECWGGRITNYNVTYPGGMIGQVHTDGQLWATCNLTAWESVGQQDMDKAHWEGLGMTNGSSNQNDAANAVYQAAINLGFSAADIAAIHTAYTDCGYTLPALATPLAEFVTTTNSTPEGNGCGSKDVTVDVTMGAAPNATTTVNISVAGTADANDVSVSPTTLTFTTANWGTDQPVTVTINGDAAIEGDETVILTISSVTGSDAGIGADDTHTLTITNDDAAPNPSGPVTVFQDNFDAGISGWTVVDGGSTTDTWYGEPAYGGASTLDGTPFLFVDSDAAGSGSTSFEQVTSPSINTMGITGMSLTFDHYFRRYAGNGDYDETATIEVFDGSVWQVLTTYVEADGDIGNWGAPSPVTLSIPDAYANANMQLRLTYDAAWDYWWAIDNMEITGTSSTDVQTQVNTGNAAQEELGPNQTVHFYDPMTGNIMCTIENLSGHDYGCTTVMVDNSGSSAQAIAGYTAATDLFFDKTYMVTPTTNNPSGAYNITFYVSDPEKTGWEMAGVRTWTSSKIFKTAGAVTAIANDTPFELNATGHGTFGAHHTITGNFATGFSGFGIVQDIVPLPIELTDINAMPQDRFIKVNWSTSTETNNEGFHLQRSVSPSTGFEDIAWIEGAGTTVEAQSYTFNDENVETGIRYYYRLKQMDYDGTSSLSEVVSAILASKGLSFDLFPNPASDMIYIKPGIFQNGRMANVSITDATGKLYRNETLEFAEEMPINVSELPSGVYFLTLESEGDVQTVKFMVE